MVNAAKMHHLTGQYLKARDAVVKGNLAATELRALGVEAPGLFVDEWDNRVSDMKDVVKGLRADLDGTTEENDRLRKEIEALKVQVN